MNDQRAAVVPIQLATDQLARLQPVDDVGQGRAFVPEFMVQRSDRKRAPAPKLGEDVGLSLGEFELADGRLEIGPDHVGPPFQGCTNFTHFVIY